MNLLSFLQPLIAKYGMKVYIDTIESIMPPGLDTAFQSTTETGKGTIILGIINHAFYEYDPDTGTLIVPISTTEAGFYRDSEHFKWNFIPLTKSIEGLILPDLSVSHKGSECVVRVVNNTDMYIYTQATIIMLEFDREHEDKVREYFVKIANMIEGG